MVDDKQDPDIGTYHLLMWEDLLNEVTRIVGAMGEHAPTQELEDDISGIMVVLEETIPHRIRAMRNRPS